jgi:hypothetical protein
VNEPSTKHMIIDDDDEDQFDLDKNIKQIIIESKEDQIAMFNINQNGFVKHKEMKINVK